MTKHTSITHLLTDALTRNQLTASQKTCAQWLHYLDLIKEWNNVFNLTTIHDPKEMVYLHLIDSLVIAPFLHGNRLLDVGSGAGLPGIPLAILNPTQHWVLLDKNSKKTRFLTQAVAELSLTNVEVVHARCEDFHPTTSFDSILSRAYGSLHLFATSTLHLLDQDGMLLAMKGKYPNDELNDLPDSVVVNDTKRLTIKGIDIERHLVCLRKKI